MNRVIKTTCLNCRHAFISKRNPNQQYCSQHQCQNIRKNLWHKKKRSSDPDYKYNHNEACKKWRNNNRDYCSNYRDSHPKYVEQNRRMSKERKRRAKAHKQNDNISRFAKSDALISETQVKSGIYRLIPEGSEFAKSDALTHALTVNIKIISMNC